jgi:hypothetical protein
VIVLPAASFAALVCAHFAPPALARSAALAISALIARAPGDGSRRSRSSSKRRASTSRLRQAALGGVSKHHASPPPPACASSQPRLVCALFYGSCADVQMLRSPLPHAPARAHGAAGPHATCGRGTACMRASHASAASTTASAPSSMVERAGRAFVGAVGEAAAFERAGCVCRCAGDLYRAIGGQRPRTHVASFSANASSASSESPMVWHHSSRRRAGAAHSTDPSRHRIAADHAGGRRACAVLDWSDGPQVVSPDSSRPSRRVAPSIDGKEEKSQINKYNPHPFRRHAIFGRMGMDVALMCVLSRFCCSAGQLSF